MNLNYFSLKKREKEVFDEITAGELLIGYLLSAGSSYRARKTARKLANERMAKTRALKRLKDKGIIVIQRDKVSLTKLGQRLSKEKSIIEKYSKNVKTKKWDGKW